MSPVQKNSNKESDLKILEHALALEIEANKRYHEQHDIVKDPKIHALLEGLHRNEIDHEKIIREHIARLIGSGSDKIEENDA